MAKNTLLLVDDEENILKSLKRILRKDNYDIITTTNPHEALEIVKKQKVPVIVSDQRMPEMEGAKLLTKIQEIDPDTIRLILSGYADFKGLVEAINRGGIHKFLKKPWDGESLREEIAEAFEIANQNEVKHVKLDLLSGQWTREHYIAHGNDLLSQIKEPTQLYGAIFLTIPELSPENTGLKEEEKELLLSQISNSLKKWFLSIPCQCITLSPDTYLILLFSARSDFLLKTLVNDLILEVNTHYSIGANSIRLNASCWAHLIEQNLEPQAVLELVKKHSPIRPTQNHRVFFSWDDNWKELHKFFNEAKAANFKYSEGIIIHFQKYIPKSADMDDYKKARQVIKRFLQEFKCPHGTDQLGNFYMIINNVLPSDLETILKKISLLFKKDPRIKSIQNEFYDIYNLKSVNSPYHQIIQGAFPILEQDKSIAIEEKQSAESLTSPSRVISIKAAGLSHFFQSHKIYLAEPARHVLQQVAVKGVSPAASNRNLIQQFLEVSTSFFAELGTQQLILPFCVELMKDDSLMGQLFEACSSVALSLCFSKLDLAQSQDLKDYRASLEIKHIGVSCLIETPKHIDPSYKVKEYYIFDPFTDIPETLKGHDIVLYSPYTSVTPILKSETLIPLQVEHSSE